MQFNVLGLSVTITRKKRTVNNVEMDDLRAIGSDSKKYLESLGSENLRNRVESVSLNSFDDIDSAGDLLQRTGIVIVPKLLQPDVVDTCQAAIQKIRKEAARLLKSGADYIESSELLIQKGAAKISGYGNLARYPKSILTIREGQDYGMIDVFNADRLSFSLRENIRPVFEDDTVLDLLGSRNASMHPRNLNLYINDSVERTRGFHVDSYDSQLKAFIYLTDVLHLGDGPYVYVKGTHKESPYRRLNQAVSSVLPIATEAPLVPHSDIVPVLASRGSLVISDQSGIHRGFPQSKGHSRSVAVMNYA